MFKGEQWSGEKKKKWNCGRLILWASAKVSGNPDVFNASLMRKREQGQVQGEGEGDRGWVPHFSWTSGDQRGLTHLKTEKRRQQNHRARGRRGGGLSRTDLDFGPFLVEACLLRADGLERGGKGDAKARGNSGKRGILETWATRRRRV